MRGEEATVKWGKGFKTAAYIYGMTDFMEWEGGGGGGRGGFQSIWLNSK